MFLDSLGLSLIEQGGFVAAVSIIFLCDDVQSKMEGNTQSCSSLSSLFSSGKKKFPKSLSVVIAHWPKLSHMSFPRHKITIFGINQL